MLEDNSSCWKATLHPSLNSPKTLNPKPKSLVLHPQDVRRVTPYPPQEVSDARRYQTRGEADRVQGRTWEGGKGEEDR